MVIELIELSAYNYVIKLAKFSIKGLKRIKISINWGHNG